MTVISMHEAFMGIYSLKGIAFNQMIFSLLLELRKILKFIENGHQDPHCLEKSKAVGTVRDREGTIPKLLVLPI